MNPIAGQKFVVAATLDRLVADGEPITLKSGEIIAVENKRQNKWWAKVGDREIMVCFDIPEFSVHFTAYEELHERYPKDFK